MNAARRDCVALLRLVLVTSPPLVAVTSISEQALACGECSVDVKRVSASAARIFASARACARACARAHARDFDHTFTNACFSASASAAVLSCGLSLGLGVAGLGLSAECALAIIGRAIAVAARTCVTRVLVAAAPAPGETRRVPALGAAAAVLVATATQRTTKELAHHEAAHGCGAARTCARRRGGAPARARPAHNRDAQR